MEEIVIFDIDGTLADISHRRHPVEKNPKIGMLSFGECLRINPSLQSCDCVTFYTHPESKFSYARGGVMNTGQRRFNGWRKME